MSQHIENYPCSFLSFRFKGQQHVTKMGILDGKSFEFDPTRINDKREVAGTK